MDRCKTQVERLLEIDRQLKENSYPNCTKLAEQFEVATKTIHRDFQYMRDRMNAPIEYDAVKKGYYYENPTFMIPACSMSEGELVSLLMASRTLAEYQGTPAAKDLRQIFSKLSEMLPDSISVNPGKLYSQLTVFSPPVIPVKPRIWEDVIKALLQKRQLEMEYETSKGLRNFAIKPLHLANLHGDWILCANRADNDELRKYALGRIRKLKLLQKQFDPPDFNADEYFSSTFRMYGGNGESYRIKLLFSKTVARRVLEREWHPSQEVIEHKNGSIELQFDAEGLVEIEHWVLSWGRHCKVLAPQKLKDQVAEEIRSMHKNIQP